MEDRYVLARTADLVLDIAEGLDGVNQKSFPGRVEEAVARAAGHAAQVAA